MKLKSFILPGFVGLVLGLAVVWWVYAFVTYEAEARIAGLDGRPEVSVDETAPEMPAGRLETFDEDVAPRPVAWENWPGFRGANHDGVLENNTELARKWPEEGPEKLWEVKLGEGYAGPAVYDGRVYLIDYDMENLADAIRCFSLEDGREIWRYSYPVKVKRNHGMSRTVPAVNGRYVVTIGPKCHVVCLDAQTGEFKWMIDLVREYGTKEPLWYAGQCPLIVENQAIFAPAGKDVLMMAVDCETGEVVWQCANDMGWEMTHCSILPMRFGGQDFYVYPGSRGVAGVSAADGTLLWETDAWYLRTNVPTPVDVGGGKIFLCAGYNKGSMMMQLVEQNGAIVPEAVFELKPEVFGSDQQTPVFYQGHIYGVRPDQQLVCMDLDGTILWTSGSGNKFGLGPYMIANGMIYILDDDGVMSLIEARPDAFVLLDRAKVLEGHESWGPPALVSGRLLVRDLTTMVCLDVASE